MSELIDREKAIEDLQNGDPSQLYDVEDIKYWLNCLPSSEQPERKKGKWDFTGWQMFQCSECKHTFTQEFLEGWSEYTYESLFPPFCPNCGAKMER